MTLRANVDLPEEAEAAAHSALKAWADAYGVPGGRACSDAR